jgi:ankyrin repeat protein
MRNLLTVSTTLQMRDINNLPSGVTLHPPPTPVPGPLFPDGVSDETKLHIAARESRDEMVLELLKRNPDLVHARNAAGLTALHVASLQSMFKMNLAVINHLLDHGADVDAQDNNGHAPLHVACGASFVEVPRLLLSRGANRLLQSKSK